jgi:hypothetical protein
MPYRYESSTTRRRASRALLAVFPVAIAALLGCSRAEGDRVASPRAQPAPASTSVPTWGGSVPDDTDDTEAARAGRDDLGRVLPPRPMLVTLEQVKVSGGGLDNQGVVAVLRDHRAQLEDCYEKQGDAKLQGTVILKFDIGPTGEVVGFAPIGETTSLHYVSCALEAITAMRFPAATDGNASVVYTLSFKPWPTSAQ